MNIVLQKTKNLPNEYSFVPPANEYSFVPSPGPNEKWFLGASLILKPAAGEKFFRCNISLCHWLVFLWGTHQFSIGVPIHFILAGTMRGKGVVRVLGSQISLSPLPHSSQISLNFGPILQGSLKFRQGSLKFDPGGSTGENLKSLLNVLFNNNLMHPSYI